MKFKGNCCTTCGVTYFPPRALCDQCGKTRLSDCTLSADSVLLVTEVFRGPGISHADPLRIELVQLSNGSLAIGRK